MTGAKETGGKETGGKATGRIAPGAKESRAQYSKETEGKSDVLVGKREMDNMFPGVKTAVQKGRRSGFLP